MLGNNLTTCSLAFLMLLLGLSASIWGSTNESAANSITVVYNHVSGDSGADLKLAGGFSAFVRFNGQTILFDAGGERTLLLHNLTELMFDPGRLDAIVISHNHWDHVYGLPGVLGATGNAPPVYVADSAHEGIRQQNPRAKIVAVEKPTKIAAGAWVVGPMSLEYRGIPFAEQALVLDHEDGLVVLVGCSHPGVVSVVETVKKQFGGKKIALVAGGFHLRSTPGPDVEAIAATLRELGVTKLAPSHCTGDEATDILRQHWTEALLAFDLGDTVRF
jgi:7,8-dihydropterin-6-yl-methyl-4-(beta-D-ribofuranosyl)aminobenzene 5'-phosphate synthase